MRSIFGILAAGLMLVSAFATPADAQFRARRGGWNGYYGTPAYGSTYNSYSYGTPYYYNQSSYGQPYWGTNSYYGSPYYGGYSSNYYGSGYASPYYGGYNTPYYGGSGYSSGYYNPGVSVNTPLGTFNFGY